MKLPPILMLHLRRFEYDWQVDANVKIMSKLEIEDELHMAKFMSKDSKSSHGDDDHYLLFGILIHQGSAAGSGHYITYIRPEMKQWYKFNDETVTKVDWRYVKMMSEGGQVDRICIDPETFEVGMDGFNTSSTAYELIYIRKSQAQAILEPITDDQIPQYVKDGVREEIEEYNRKEFLEHHTALYITSIDRILGTTGVGCGVEFKGIYDRSSTSRFMDQPELSMVYLAQNTLTLESFLEDLESRTNLRRDTYQIYKYSKGTLGWVPFLVKQTIKSQKTKTLREMFQKDFNRILMIVPINPQERVL